MYQRVIIFSFIISLFLGPLISKAVTNTAGINSAGINTAGVNSAQSVSLTNPITSDDIPSLIGNVIKAILSIVGSLALVMFIYGGFTWMLAGGNSEKVKKGKDILTWAAIGLVVIFSSYALVKFVIEQVGGA